MKTRVRLFIGSSSEALPFAEALQENLESIAECTVWNQGVFELSKSVYGAIIEELCKHDYAAFVFAPDDVAIIRGHKKPVTRDNVIFELGLFAGIMGREKAFIVSPTDVDDFHLPSDLAGIIYAGYKSKRSDGNDIAALAVAAGKIKRQIAKNVASGEIPRLEKIGWFTDFMPRFPELLKRAKDVEVYFIHSRRWREDNHEQIKDFLRRDGTTLKVNLPNRKNRFLLKSLAAHFDDGPHIPGFIDDAYGYFERLSKEFGADKVLITSYEAYPTYSFYRFDNVFLVAMYRNSKTRGNVPTFLCSSSHPFGRFIEMDLHEQQTSE